MDLRKELPPLPDRIARLPRARGYPVPWFAAWLDDDGEPVPRGEGTPDFRVVHPETAVQAVREDRCWVCGDRLGRFKAFTIGPMCAVNRTSAEPPGHRECAEFSAKACPFLTRPHARRREAGLPEPEDRSDMPGIALMRNPGVAGVWITKNYHRFRAQGGILFQMGAPEEVLWFCEGRAARREEVMASIDSGLPALREVAEQEEGAVEALEREVERAMELVPA